jgi:hypothetical protein
MNENPLHTARGLGPWGWAVIIVLAGFLAAAISYAIYGWNRLGDVGIPPVGWAFLIAGIVVTVLVGAGLMGLIFYSSRKGRDF